MREERIMCTGRSGVLRNAMIMVALFAVITLGFVAMDSDDSFADSSGNVMSGIEVIGTYEFDSDSGQLDVTASSSDHYDKIPTDLIDTSTSVSFSDKSSVQKIVIDGFRKDLSDFFSKYGVLVDGVPNPT